RFAPIQFIFRMARRKPKPVTREKPALAVVPASKFRITGADVTDAGKIQVDFYIVIVVIENRVAIDGQRSLADGALEMHVLNPAENVARHSVLLLKLRIVAGDVQAADSQFDPVLRRLFFNGGAIFVYRRLVIAGAERRNCEQDRERESGVKERAFHLVTQMPIDLRAVDGFVAPGRPAGALR